MFLKPQKSRFTEFVPSACEEDDILQMKSTWACKGWRWMDVPEQFSQLPKRVKEMVGESKAASVLLDNNQRLVFFINYEKMFQV